MKKQNKTHKANVVSDENYIGDDPDLQGNVIEADENEGGVEKLQKECEEYKQNYLRALADYKNLEHRVQNQRMQAESRIRKEILIQMLEILDVIDQAEMYESDHQGLKMIADQFRKTMGQLGVQELDLFGDEFNPEVAEVVEVVEGREDDVVVEVVQKGYALNGEVMRHAKVKVSKKINN